MARKRPYNARTSRTAIAAHGGSVTTLLASACTGGRWMDRDCRQSLTGHVLFGWKAVISANVRNGWKADD